MNVRALLLLAALVGAGCAPQEAPRAEAKDAPRVVAGKYVDASGQLLCPVMDSPIKSEKEAAGKLTHDGVTYYVCCDPCIEKFKQDPTQYAVRK